MTIKNSGDNTQYKNGATRDNRKGKGRYDLLPAHALSQIAKHFEAGAAIHGDANWKGGIPLSRFLDSTIRHLVQFLGGARDEPHLQAAAWNILCLLETRHLHADNPEVCDLPAFPEDPYASPPRPSGPLSPEVQDQIREFCRRRPPVVDGLSYAYGPEEIAEEVSYAKSEHPLRLALFFAALVWDEKSLLWQVQDRPYVYIAGPMRGLPLFNYRAFSDAMETMAKAGYLVLNPAILDSVRGDSTHVNVAITDLECLAVMTEGEDSKIALLPGWKDSVGASAEASVARWLGIRPLLMHEDLKGYSTPYSTDHQPA